MTLSVQRKYLKLPDCNITLWLADRMILVVCTAKTVKHLAVADFLCLAELFQRYPVILIEKQSHFGGIEASFFFLVDHSMKRLKTKRRKDNHYILGTQYGLK